MFCWVAFVSVCRPAATCILIPSPSSSITDRSTTGTIRSEGGGHHAPDRGRGGRRSRSTMDHHHQSMATPTTASIMSSSKNKSKNSKKQDGGERSGRGGGGGSPPAAMRKGPWTEEEDAQLVWFVRLFGERRWDFLAMVSGLRGGGCILKHAYIYIYADIRICI